MDMATFGATCSPCSAQFIKNFHALEFIEQYPEAARAIVENHYVDDYNDSVDTEAEAIKLAKKIRLKGVVLSVVMASFDPVGQITPITIRGKMLKQDLWRTGCDWVSKIDWQSTVK